MLHCDNDIVRKMKTDKMLGGRTMILRMLNPRHIDAEYITADGLWSILKSHGSNTVVLDVRPPDAYANGHIPGAVRTSMYGLSQNPIAPPVVAKRVIAYSEDERSEEIAASLRTRYPNSKFYVLKGGWLSWIRAGLPVDPHPSTLLKPWQLVDGMDMRLISDRKPNRD
jgi:rhodanese-related sulfurtransferase